MPAKIRVVSMYTKVLGSPGVIVNTTSKADKDWQRDLSPFHLGPCHLYGNRMTLLHENGWQFSKVFAKHADAQGNPTQEYWDWAERGWSDTKPHRYPMGRGAKPLYSLWDGARLGYIEARKTIYGPLYAEAVQKTAGWARLKELFYTHSLITLRDYDGYDIKDNSLTQVLNNPCKRMGHAFVLAMLLLNDPALQQLQLRI